MKSLLIALLLSTTSCSLLPSLVEREKRVGTSLPQHLYGPVDLGADLQEVKRDLARWGELPRVGRIWVQLITPAYLYLNAFHHKHGGEGPQERQKKVDLEIDYTVRYETCFSLDLHAQRSIATEFRYWDAYVSYGEDYILPAKITDTTLQVHRPQATSEAQLLAYRGLATICTLDKMSLEDPFTLVLTPQFEPGLGSLRLSWKSPDWQLLSSPQRN